MIDTHCHLNHTYFEDDFEEMLTRAVMDGVAGFVNIGFDPESALATLELVERFPFFYGVVGVHPHDAELLTDDFETQLRGMLRHPRVTAVGEIGLDFYRDLSPREVQRETFIRMLRMAKELDRPIVIHCRDAFDDVIEVLKTEGDSYRGIFHAFAGSPEQAAQVLELGFHVGIGGVVTFRNSSLGDTLESIPLERIVIETDSPYLTPQPFRGMRNEPAYVAHVARYLAKVKKWPVEDILRITTSNFMVALGVSESAMSQPVYKIGDKVYIHIAQASKSCDEAQGLNDMIDHFEADELVICGFGETLDHLDRVMSVAEHAKGKGWRTRLNTSGLGNQIADRDVTPELAKSVDEVVVLFYGTTATQHDHVIYGRGGEEQFEVMRDFVRCSVKAGMDTLCEFIAVPKFSPEQCRAFARDLGAQYDIRMYRS